MLRDINYNILHANFVSAEVSMMNIFNSIKPAHLYLVCHYDILTTG